MPEEIRVRDAQIRLGQLLKFAGLADSGSEVKRMLAEDGVTVNGEPEDRRGRQLAEGDVVRVGEHELVVAAG